MLKSHAFWGWVLGTIFIFALEFQEYGFTTGAVLEGVAFSVLIGLSFVILDWASKIE